MLTKQEISHRYNAEVWKAKYEVVASLVEQKHVDAAGKLVECAATLARQTGIPFSDAVEQLVFVACTFKAADRG